MPSIELSAYRIPDPRRPGKTYVTRFKMTAADAEKRYPGAVAVEGTREFREVGGEIGPGFIAGVVAAGGAAPGHNAKSPATPAKG